MERPINERELDALRWEAEDCPAAKWPEGDCSYKTSAKALQSRGLVNITGHARTWKASITGTGTDYLEHGDHLGPAEQTRARYRRALHACRARHLAPKEQELRFTGHDFEGIIIQLGTSSSEEEKD